MPSPNFLDTSANAQSFLDRSRMLVCDYFNYFAEKTDDYTLRVEDVYVVWGCKTLQNWKTLVSTNVNDGMYYEVTHNGDKGETYIDAYKKFNNVCVKDDPQPVYDPGQEPLPARDNNSQNNVFG